MNMTRLRAVLCALSVLPGLSAAPAAAAEPSFDDVLAAPFVSTRREASSEFRFPAGRPVGWSRERARGRDRYDGGYRSRRMSCVGTDDGWEEHWRPHGGEGASIAEACRACREHHGRCDYSCSVDAYKCKSEWVPDAPNAPRETYEGRQDEDERDAEDNAVGACRDDHWRTREEGRCRLLSCDRVQKLVDSGSCR